MADVPPYDRACVRRPYPDGTTDSICRHCFATIARAKSEAELDCAERDHVCDPELLKRLRLPFPNHLRG